MRPPSVLAILVALAAFAAPPAPADAQAGIRVHVIERVRVDGSLRDWSGIPLTTVGTGGDASMAFALAQTDEGLYVAARVSDDRLVRTASPGTTEDAVILTLASTGRRSRAVDFYLFAGVAGRSPAQVSSGPLNARRLREVRGARIVEGPLRRGRGYIVEAFIPFRAIPGGENLDRLRGSMRLRDVDSEAHPTVESEPSLVAVDARHRERLIPLMPAGGAGGALEQFLTSRGLAASRPTHDLRGDVAGDARPERVFVVDRYLVISGPDLPGGGYAFHELPVANASDVRSAELTELTGDGKAELVIVLRQRNAAGERDLWQVMSLNANPVRALFGIEVRKAVRRGSIEARVRVLRARRRGQAPQIEVRAGRATGLDAASYREAPATDAEPMIVPWGPVASRRYRWDGSRFARVSEQPNRRYRPPAEPSSAGPSAPSGAPTAEAPAAEAPDDEALIAGFRREAGIPRGARPRYRFRVNVAGSRAPETVQVYGHTLVIVGPGIRSGRSWFQYNIGVASDDDLLEVRTADVTGDRRAEVLLRIRQTIGPITRELLTVHQVTDTGLRGLAQIEVRRAQGPDSVANDVVTTGGRLEVRPGHARGWSAARWPFSDEASPGIDSILLPWRDSPARYRFARGRLTR